MFVYVYLYVCMHSMCIYMYMSMHIFMSVCERCIQGYECIETLHVWHICNSKNYVYS